MQRDDDGAECFLGVIGIVGIGDQELLQTEGSARRGIHLAARSGLAARLGLTARQRPLYLGEEFFRLPRATQVPFRHGGVLIGAVGVALGVLAQQAQQDALGGEHRIEGVAGSVAEHLGQLGFEAGGTFGGGFLLGAGEVGDEVVEDGLGQRVNDFTGRFGDLAGGPGDYGHWEGGSRVGKANGV